MALPKKGLRKITVDDLKYAWSVTGNDGCIYLHVIPLEPEGQILAVQFDYHSEEIREIRNVHGAKSTLHSHFLITPYIVRQAIQYALSNGWQPQQKGTFTVRDMDDKIDLRLISPKTAET
jgi:hypothetical protein